MVEELDANLGSKSNWVCKFGMALFENFLIRHCYIDRVQSGV